jgi:hypothetical protein
MNPISAEQRRRNEQSRSSWDRFAAHRRRVTEILCAAGLTGGRRLCVLGAGNCNDVNLPHLVAAFREVHLVDLDSTALREGAVRQSVLGHPRLRIYGDVDVTGSLPTLGEWAGRGPPSAREVDRWITAVSNVPCLPLPAPYDVVASVCLLTQLIDSVVIAIGERAPMFVQCVTALRSQHLRLLLDLTGTGGTGILITDFVSSLTTPSLLHLPEQDLHDSVEQWIGERNFFTGVNPYMLCQRLLEEPPASRIANVQMLPPWRWECADRAYAVTAIVAERGAARSSTS